jgi:chemotaxis protein CheX
MEQLTNTYQSGIHEIVADLFRTMLATEVAPTPASEHVSPDQITALVAFGGTWRGALEFKCGFTEATQFARRFLQDEEMREYNEDVRDTVGELANIVAGNLKALMPPQVNLCPPSVVEGRDYTVSVCRGTVLVERSFATDVGNFSVRLIEDGTAMEGHA